METGREKDRQQDHGTVRYHKRYHDSVATPSPISRLPNELMIHVLRLFRNSCSKASDYIDAVTCCKQWAGLGIPLTYADLVVDDCRKLTSFTNVFPQRHLSYVTSLTLLLTKHCVDNVEDNTAAPSAGTFDLFLSKLVQMTRLKTFSLTIDDQPSVFVGDSHRTDSFLEGFVKNCLDALPRSVINLELSTSKMRVSTLPLSSGEWPSTHLCTALNEILPRLHRLSLQLRDACPLIFGTSRSPHTLNAKFPLLREVFIDISSPMNALVAGNGSIMTRRLSKLCHVGRYKPRHNVPSATEMICQVILRDLRKAIEQDAFPGIRTFTIHRAELSERSNEGRGFVHILDLVANTTTSIPVLLQVEDTGTTKSYKIQMYCISGKVEMPVGMPNVPYLADLGAWYNTSNGPRLPGISDDHEYDHGHEHFFRTFRKQEILPRTLETDFGILLIEDRKERERCLASRGYRWDGLLETDPKYGLFPPGYKPTSALIAEIVMQFGVQHLYSIVLLGETTLEPVE